MPDRPTGTVTFLFTDIEGSTRLWEHQADLMQAAFQRQEATMRNAIAAHGGYAYKMIGDAFQAAFQTAPAALHAALAAQRALKDEPWGAIGEIRVRMALHTGVVEERGDDYVGPVLNRVARLMSAGYGGQILLTATTRELVQDVLPADVTLRDLGQHRLKDLIRPEHVYQVVVPDLQADFPALKAIDARPNNLPGQLTGFIGRETELRSLKNLLSDGTNRLVTLVAPGGMGKTRLAVEAAGQMYQNYAQGVCFVALDRLKSADMIVQAVAEALPISLASREDPKTRIVDYLRAGATLVVLDNFEHVLDGAMFVQELLEAAPRAQVLATSRVKLNLMGETSFNIGGLTVDAASPEQNSAIQLFAQSARRTQPGFELDDAVLPTVMRICRLIDGMPLAIVLSAAWINTLSVDEIAAEIETGIDILETERRDVPERQRSVRAVIESSWSQVDSAAQSLLTRLTVFRGGFTRAAAQEAAAASLRGLSQLVDKALVRRDLDTGRYAIHELVRQFAEEQLAQSAEAERAAHEAHATYFADFMKTREARLRDHRQKAALVEIEADIDNIRVAWNYWAERQAADRLLGFVSVWWTFLEVRGSYTPAIQLFQAAAQKLTASAPDIVCARAVLQARQAWFTALIGLPDEGLRLAQESVNTLREYNAQDISIETLQCVNINAIFLNNYQVVRETSQEMMARAGRSGDIWEQGWASVWWGYALVLQRQIPEALQAGQAALAIFERLENPLGASVASGIVLGSISMAIGDTGAAKAYFSRGVQEAEAINNLRVRQLCYDNLGTVALLEGDVEQAQQFFGKSLRITRECGQTREMLASLRDFAGVYMAQGDLESALQLVAVVLSHPASEQNSLNRPEPLRDETEKLRAQIENRLDQPSYRSVWEAGRRRRLADVVAQILD